MHEFVSQDHEVLSGIAEWIAGRLSAPSATRPAASAQGSPAGVVLPELTAQGVGAEAAWASLRDAVFPTAFPTDHPRYLAFVGGAPTTASVLADVALSAAAVYGGSELEAGAVVAAERAAIAWLCRLLGYPPTAHGTFVSGGSTANLSALVAARHGRTSASGRPPGVIVVGAAAHSSVQAAAAIMGCTVAVAGAPDAPLRAVDLEPVLEALDPADVVAVVASAGATNTGYVDDLAELARYCAGRIWLHVDAAYGGAAMLARAHRDAFAGIECADSVTIDPHKWLFTPFDCAAVLYRDPALARAAHRQHADYLDAVNEPEDADNPADYAVHLTRRARGLPLWASILANGTDAYVDAVERCLAMAGYAAKQVDSSPVLQLATAPQLSVVLFRRTGWEAEDYARWSHQARVSGLGLVTPTTFAGRTVLRLCFVNPRTTADDVDLLLASLAEDGGRLEDRTGVRDRSARPAAPRPVWGQSSSMGNGSA